MDVKIRRMEAKELIPKMRAVQKILNEVPFKVNNRIQIGVFDDFFQFDLELDHAEWFLITFEWDDETERFHVYLDMQIKRIYSMDDFSLEEDMMVGKQKKLTEMILAEIPDVNIYINEGGNFNPNGSEKMEHNTYKVSNINLLWEQFYYVDTD